MARDNERAISTIIGFFEEIGIPVSEGRVEDGSFLPGIEVRAGGLLIDRSTVLHAGDLLHEAGHIAVSPSAARPTLSGTVEILTSIPELVELEAILWSYAACLHLGIDPRVVFHEHGYHGRSESLLGNFELGVYLGVQGLEAAGLTLSPAEAAKTGLRPFPVMQKWLRD